VGIYRDKQISLKQKELAKPCPLFPSCLAITQPRPIFLAAYTQQWDFQRVCSSRHSGDQQSRRWSKGAEKP